MNTACALAERPTLSPKFAGLRITPFLMAIEAWIPSQIQAISPMVDRLMQLIKRSRCAAGNESDVELALREALNNAVVHGNGQDCRKVVTVLCRCEWGKGVSLTVRDQGKGFDPNTVPDPLAPESLEAEHGRGIYLMKTAMDEISFERGGTEVQMRKRLARPNRRPVDRQRIAESDA